MYKNFDSLSSYSNTILMLTELFLTYYQLNMYTQMKVNYISNMRSNLDKPRARLKILLPT